MFAGINNINIIIMLFLSLDIHSFPFHLAGDNRIDLLFFVFASFSFYASSSSTSLLIINLFLIQYALRLVLAGRAPFSIKLIAFVINIERGDRRIYWLVYVKMK